MFPEGVEDLGKLAGREIMKLAMGRPGASPSRQMWTRVLAIFTLQPVAARRMLMLQHVEWVQGAGGRVQERLLMASFFRAGSAGAKFAALPQQGGFFVVWILLSTATIKGIAIWSAYMIWELTWLSILHLLECAAMLFPSRYSCFRTKFFIF
jgi:hypothetical protein